MLGNEVQLWLYWKKKATTTAMNPNPNKPDHLLWAESCYSLWRKYNWWLIWEFTSTVISLSGTTCQKKMNKAYSVLGIIKRNFIYMEEHTFISLYKSIVCRHDEYANSVWCPFKIGDIKEIKKIQNRSSKLIIKLKNKPYIDRRT